MNRRNTLFSTAVTLSVGLSGCSLLTTGPSGDGPTLPEGLSVETAYWDGCVLKNTPVCDTEDPQNAYNAMLSNRETARNRLVEDATAGEFVEATDFAESYLLLVQYRMQSARRLRLQAVEQTDTGLRVVVVTESQDGSYADDSVPHTLAIRVTDERSDTPQEISVSVDGDRTGTIERSA